MKILTLLIMFITVFFSDHPKSTVNYDPKPLQKSLEKMTMCPGIQKEEIRTPDSQNSVGPGGRFFSVKCDSSQQLYVYIGRVNSCRAGGCSVNNTSEEYEFFDYYAIYDSLLNVVQVNVFNYEATHGQEITSRGWLRQFIGYNSSKKIEAGKNIDAISGATISVNAIIEDIQEKTGILEAIVNVNRNVSVFRMK